MKRWCVALSREYQPLAVREGSPNHAGGSPAFYHDNYRGKPPATVRWLREQGGAALLFLDAPDELGAFVKAQAWLDKHRQTGG